MKREISNSEGKKQFNERGQIFRADFRIQSCGKRTARQMQKSFDTAGHIPYTEKTDSETGTASSDAVLFFQLIGRNFP
jgi:hypothetical protein